MDRNDVPGLTLIERNVTGITLHDAYARLGELAKLEANWDSYGADPPTTQAIAVASGLLNLLAERLADSVGERIRPWFIAPVANGGVQLEWRGPDRAVEIEIGPGGVIGYLVEEGCAPRVRLAEDDDISLEEALGPIARVIAP